ncbi:MAG: SO_0444 family Cu/Zn efflux transporter [Desulfovibrio sp.]
MTPLAGIGAEVWHTLLDAAPYVLLGFFIAGLLKGFLPKDFLSKHLGPCSKFAVVKAAVFGIPLPLCSCGVIPTAAALRKEGAGRGATASFLVSTPETGVDSIAVTYALMDPIMTVVRPVSAFITAIFAGLLTDMMPEKEQQVDISQHAASPCGCGDSGCGGLQELNVQPKKSAWVKFKEGMKFAFGEMLSDIGLWLVVGILAAAVISWLVPDGFFERFLGNEYLSMLVMLGVGIPVYVCATASTPIAASLILKGLSPGAALVFLLAGPATNVATITIISRMLGRKAVLAYLAAIAIASLAMGFALNRIYEWMDISPLANIGEIGETLPYWVSAPSAVILIVLVIWSIIPKKGDDCHCHDNGDCHC